MTELILRGWFLTSFHTLVVYQIRIGDFMESEQACHEARKTSKNWNQQ